MLCTEELDRTLMYKSRLVVKTRSVVASTPRLLELLVTYIITELHKQLNLASGSSDKTRSYEQQ